MPAIVIATDSIVYEKILSNVEEIKAREGIVIILASEKDKKAASLATGGVVFMPRTIELLSPVLNTIALQIFAYYVANILGCDVDQPRNLAKSVVVE